MDVQLNLSMPFAQFLRQTLEQVQVKGPNKALALVQLTHTLEQGIAHAQQPSKPIEEPTND